MIGLRSIGIMALGASGRDLYHAADCGDYECGVERLGRMAGSHSHLSSTYSGGVKRRNELVVEVTLWAGLQPWANNQKIM